MFRKFFALSIIAIAILTVACAPAPTPAPVVQTVVVQQTVVVPQTVVVTAVPAATATAAPTATSAVPTIPASVAVTLDVKTTALLILDITSVVCTPRKTCVASLPALTAFLKKARDAKVPVVYSDTATAGSTILPEVAQLPDEPKVTARADKFFGTTLDDILKAKGVKTAVIVGSASNGAVLYTSFGANLRGYTVVVAEDGISTDDVFAQFLTRYQLLNQPGFTNAQNTPPQEGRVAVTLSRTDLIAFK
ncbi:MAG: cysteine hydrolase [Burkholderiales bacterium]|nr:cysteine hydrolase [Burkholderiales bacterium]